MTFYNFNEKELLLQESDSVISLVEIYIMKCHSKMTSLQCPSDLDNNWRLGLVLIRLLDLMITYFNFHRVNMKIMYALQVKNLKDL